VFKVACPSTSNVLLRLTEPVTSNVELIPTAPFNSEVEITVKVLCNSVVPLTVVVPDTERLSFKVVDDTTVKEPDVLISPSLTSTSKLP
jgi:hypothetical protein